MKAIFEIKDCYVKNEKVNDGVRESSPIPCPFLQDFKDDYCGETLKLSTCFLKDDSQPYIEHTWNLMKTCPIVNHKTLAAGVITVPELVMIEDNEKESR